MKEKIAALDEREARALAPRAPRAIPGGSHVWEPPWLCVAIVLNHSMLHRLCVTVVSNPSMLHRHDPRVPQTAAWPPVALPPPALAKVLPHAASCARGGGSPPPPLPPPLPPVQSGHVSSIPPY